LRSARVSDFRAQARIFHRLCLQKPFKTINGLTAVAGIDFSQI
jgi:hypothetical protein